METEENTIQIYKNQICQYCLNKTKSLCQINKNVDDKNCITYKCINYTR